MAFAASSDLLTMRISNRLVLLLVCSFFVVAFVADLPLDQLGWHVGCAAIVLVVGFAFFAFGWIGGGDAKLAAATTLWLGFGLTLPYLVYAALLGGALTLGDPRAAPLAAAGRPEHGSSGSTACTTARPACPMASRSPSPACWSTPTPPIFQRLAG